MSVISAGPLTFSQVKADLLSKRYLHEEPPKSNRTPFGAWYGWNGVAWCAIFMSWLFRIAPQQMGGKVAYVPYLANRYKAAGRYGKTAKVGAFAIFNGQVHVEMVLEVHDAYLITGGGNTSASDGSNFYGGEVAVKKRYRSSIEGYCYPIYAKPTPAPTPAPAPGNSTANPKYPLATGHFFGKDDGTKYSHSGKNNADIRSIKKIQTTVNGFLKARKKPLLKVDGSYGPKTYAAVKAWQYANRAKIADHKYNGKFGRNSWNAAY